LATYRIIAKGFSFWPFPLSQAFPGATGRSFARAADEPLVKVKMHRVVVYDLVAFIISVIKARKLGSFKRISATEVGLFESSVN
jgi:hypothetical protein